MMRVATVISCVFLLHARLAVADRGSFFPRKSNQLTTPPTSTNTQPTPPIKSLFEARCAGGAGDDAALWSYQGSLYDPLEGKRIAHVQGLELIQPIASCHGPDEAGTFIEKCKNLIAGSLVTQQQATFDYASTYISRKVFCYTTVSDEDDRTGGKPTNSLLKTIRVRPQSPLRNIPDDQSIALFNTVTTMIQRNENELILHTEWPKRTSIWGTTTFRSTSSTDIEFAIYAKKRSQKVAQQHPDLSAPPLPKAKDGSTVPVISPKRSALVQFGASNMEEQKNRFGARETYSYTFSTPTTATAPSEGIGFLSRLLPRPKATSTKQASLPTCQVRYTRYGEGPPFYAPNRMCTLELQGKRIASLDEAGPTVRDVVRERIPHLLQQPQQQQDGGFASLFRQRLDILPDPREPPKTWKERRMTDMERAYRRVKKATKLSQSTADD